MPEALTKIGLLAGSLKGAGGEKTILTLAEALAQQGCQVDLYLLNQQADYTAAENVNLIQLPGKHKREKKRQLGKRSRAAGYQLFVTSRPDFYDYAHAENTFASVHITPYAWLKNEKKSRLSKYLKYLRIKKKFNHKQLIALSQGIKDDLVNNLGCRENDITVINNPFDTDTIFNAAQEAGNLPPNPYMVYIAALIPRKRHKDLILAYKELDTDLDLVLVGKGPLEHELKSLVNELGLSDRIIFWGWDPNPYRLIKNARLSLLTSEAEGLPRVLIESLLLGVPVVSTDCPSGPNEVMTGELRQYLIPVGDINGLTKAMQSALGGYPEFSNLNLERFSSKQVALRYLELIKK
jgi:glycosyltransferase involved in cell wall biosynthesis